MGGISVTNLKMHFTCGVCQQEFIVPWSTEIDDLSPEMIEVIEHEEKHWEDGEIPSWQVESRVKFQ